MWDTVTTAFLCPLALRRDGCGWNKNCSPCYPGWRFPVCWKSHFFRPLLACREVTALQASAAGIFLFFLIPRLWQPHPCCIHGSVDLGRGLVYRLWFEKPLIQLILSAPSPCFKDTLLWKGSGCVHIMKVFSFTLPTAPCNRNLDTPLYMP